MANLGMNVVVPLGGLGSRFQKEGYLTRCKPFVPVLGKPMILWVLDGLSLRDEDTLVIVYNPSFMGIGNFMREVVGAKYPDCKFVELEGPTRGAAETVLIGLKGIDESLRKRPTLLADGDTFYTADIVNKFRAVAATHNAVFCFHDTQPKPIYSYVRLDDSDDVLEVKEKIKISDWANSGCYCFRDGTQLASECEMLIEKNLKQASQDGVGEFYTSGVIATMLEKKEPFRALKLDLDSIQVLGTPAQVAEFCKTWSTQPRQRFIFDLEGALIIEESSAPIERNVEACKRYKAQGHTIIIQSTRPHSMMKKTWALLEELGIPCDDLRMGKPVGDFYIGGSNTVDALITDLDKQVGFYPTEVRASAPSQDSRPVKLRKPTMNSIGALHPESRGVTCVVKILAAPEQVAVQSARFSNKPAFWECACGDETGKIVLSMTDAQKEGLTKDQVVVLRNASIKMVNRHMRIIVGKWGKIDRETSQTIDVVGDIDVSAVEYELVGK
eukprot:TRINITY_DN15388_c0_g2_i1.p1 TRINITY_DN15388_c0_g2~~TRINITY_DN15388_c0_g2_i1.p1  ORF type:complete len:522 (-),score=91.61 TRINITY_DN15388_c0_g2_i1:102-1595(-)